MSNTFRNYFYGLIFFCFWLSLVACQKTDEFDQGHEWIVPRPAAEIQLTILDDERQPLPGATIWLAFGGEKIEDANRVLDYDVQRGVKTGPEGTAIIHYLGETGGGFELPLNAPPQPKFELVVETPSGASTRFDLDTLLFRSAYQIGETTLTDEGETISAKIVAHTISFGDE